jgi:hypothetical protein
MFLKPLMPVISGYNSIPFGSLSAFFALYLGMINNNKLSRFVRWAASRCNHHLKECSWIDPLTSVPG